MPMAATAAIEIVDYEAAHGEYIADHIRMCDRREIYYMSTLKPLPAIRATAATAARKKTVLIDGLPALMFGVSRRTFLSDVGVPWLLGTGEADKYQYRFGRQSKVFFEEMASHFPVMENWTLAENTKIIRWLRWLGFDTDEPKPCGAFNASFVRFHRGQ